MAFSKYKPFMAYIDDNDMERIRKIADDTKVSVSKIIREGIAMRLAGDNKFADGYNQGITKSIGAIHETDFAQMRFPSGRTFADLVEIELVKHMWRESEDAA